MDGATGEQSAPVKEVSVRRGAVLRWLVVLPTGGARTKGNVHGHGVRVHKAGHAEIMRPAQWEANKRGEHSLLMLPPTIPNLHSQPT